MRKTSKRFDPLTVKHYTIFGKIVVEYSSLEVGLRLTLAAFMGQGVHKALIYSAPYSSVHLRNVTKAIVKDTIPADHAWYPFFIDILGVHKANNTLRNDIAHNLWRKGDRPRSIAPVYMEIRNERAELKGLEEEDNRDYTMAEFEKAYSSLARANFRLARLHQDAAFQSLFDRNTSQRSQDRDESDGNS